MKTIVTQNSTYEVDEEKKLVRRTAGKNQPTRYIGADGEWRPYSEMTLVGDGLLFVGENENSPGFYTSTVLSTTDA